MSENFGSCVAFANILYPLMVEYPFFCNLLFGCIYHHCPSLIPLSSSTSPMFGEEPQRLITFKEYVGIKSSFVGVELKKEPIIETRVKGFAALYGALLVVERLSVLLFY